jgi:hypothetical protein
MIVKESKPKLLDVLDNLILNLQANDDRQGDVEWQVVMIAREVLSLSSTKQLSQAINNVGQKVMKMKGELQLPSVMVDLLTFGD